MKSATNANQNTKKESHPMMTQQTLTQLRSLKLSGMADALQQQLTPPAARAWRADRRCVRHRTTKTTHATVPG